MQNVVLQSDISFEKQTIAKIAVNILEQKNYAN